MLIREFGISISLRLDHVNASEPITARFPFSLNSISSILEFANAPESMVIIFSGIDIDFKDAV